MDIKKLLILGMILSVIAAVLAYFAKDTDVVSKLGS